MDKVRVVYPNADGAWFDCDYYLRMHMQLVQEHLGPFGLLRISVDKGLCGEAGAEAPFLCIGHLYFERKEAFDEDIRATGQILRPDIPIFTNIVPLRLISEELS